MVSKDLGEEKKTKGESQNSDQAFAVDKAYRNSYRWKDHPRVNVSVNKPLLS